MVIPVYRKNISELTGQRAVEPAGTSPSLCAPALSGAPLGSSLSPLWRPGHGPMSLEAGGGAAGSFMIGQDYILATGCF